MSDGDPDPDATRGPGNGNGNGEGSPGPEPDDPFDVDAAFEEIIAYWSEEADPDAGSGRWRDSEDRPSPPDAPTGGPGTLDLSGPDLRAGGAPGAHREPADRRVDLPENSDPLPVRPVRRRREFPPRAGRHAADHLGAGDHSGDPTAEHGERGPTSAEVPSDIPAPREVDPDRFVPPEPPPLPRGDLASRLLWACTLGGPAFLLLAALVWRDAPGLLIVLAVVAFVGGFLTLVLRMPHERGDDDDGAVV